MARKKVIQPKKVRVEELMKLIPNSLLEELALEMEADKWVPKLKAKQIFLLIMYTLLEGDRISLRYMEEIYNSPDFKDLIGLELSDTAYSSIRDRLISLDSSYFEKIYEHLYQGIHKHYDEPELGKYNIKRYDSTMIAVFGHLLSGMKVGNTQKNKTQVKLTTEFTNDFLIRLKFFKDQDHLSEETALKELIMESTPVKDDLIVFDRGLKSRKVFKELTEQKTQFVTRLNLNARYQILEAHQSCIGVEDENLEYLWDNIVYLYGNASKLYKEPLRMIKVKIKEKNSYMFLLTNVLDLPIQQIAEVYKKRWDIEVLFRFMKQEMNATHFVSNNSNAIQTMIYSTLITTMLLLIYKKLNKISSYKIAKIRFFKELKATVLLRILEASDGTIWMKQNLKYYIQKE
ncbi:MAG: IS4 family transposase [Saprospiraceae bacterium]